MCVPAGKLDTTKFAISVPAEGPLATTLPDDTVADAPSIATSGVLDPAAKPVPKTETVVPTAADEGVTAVIVGAVTVKKTWL